MYATAHPTGIRRSGCDDSTQTLRDHITEFPLLARSESCSVSQQIVGNLEHGFHRHSFPEIMIFVNRPFPSSVERGNL